MAWVGQKGSGKTLVVRSIGQLFYGEGFRESVLPDDKDDFMAIVNNQPLAFIDNYDSEVTWANDILAAVATGTSVQLRELFTTSDLAKFNPDCWIAITSRDPPLNRDDVADRTLVFRVARLDSESEEFVGMGDYQNQIHHWRDEILSDYVDNLREILAEYQARDTATMSSSHRMADWAIFAHIVADALGIDKIDDLLNTMETERAVFALEDDETALLLMDWARDNPSEAGQPYGAGELVDILEEVEDEYDGKLDKKSAAGFGSWLFQHRDELRTLLNMEIDKSGRSNQYWFDVSDSSDGPGSRVGLNQFA